jgi:hypothetical protein
MTAVSTLVLGDRAGGGRRAALLGLAWGAGHAATLFVFGLPVVLASSSLPDSVHRVVEAIVGTLIIVLALRLLVRRRRGPLELAPAAERSRRTAFGIGTVHGLGGSAGASGLLLGGISTDGEAVAALVLFAVAGAVSMSVVSGLLGRGMAAGPVLRRFDVVAPVLAVFALVFGVVYLLGAATGG